MKIYKHKDGRCNASGPQIKALRGLRDSLRSSSRQRYSLPD